MAQELLTAQKWISAGQSVAIAIVARTWGSAPRRAGSMMVIREDGTFEGSVSGGCVEGTVIAEAASLLSELGSSTSKTFTFSVASEEAWSVGLACGGEIEVRLFLVGNKEKPAINDACKALINRGSGLLKFALNSNTIIFEDLSKSPTKHSPYEGSGYFTAPIIPSLRIDIVGAVHIAQHLAVMSGECGFEVRVIDPRSAFTENRLFGAAKMINAWPDEFFSKHRPDVTTAVVTLTHDPKLDDAALNAVLTSDAFYLGCLGSKKTHAARLKRLSELGYNETTLEKIHGPVGLDIGAATPAEIAVSILSQIIDKARLKS